MERWRVSNKCSDKTYWKRWPRNYDLRRPYQVFLLECQLISRSTTNRVIAAAVFVAFVAPIVWVSEDTIGSSEGATFVVLEEGHTVSAAYWFHGIDIYVVLLPLFAFLFGYGTIASERDDGTLTVLGSLPVTRFDIYIGKALARILVFSGIIFVGVLAGLFGIFVTNPMMASPYGHLLASVPTVLFGTALVSIAIAVSSLLSSRLHALSGAIVGYFGLVFGAVWTLGSAPLAIVGHPFHGYSTVIATLFDTMYPSLEVALSSGSQSPDTLLLFVTGPVAILVLFAWICGPLAIGYLGFRREVILS
ncbi:ABC transporter permease subunit [Natronobacterium texcoconense]|uniref:ABC-type transport system involved in multi-copper enzyme maturation, permease component n=1 Tax=Natronobacterium texcoconense TaxID=1095778 RepID=A0A1H0Z745_NATTX|nr:ABC transporter permease subunit [Natronobacterium texcoconense]SDQ23289.1 ABC-type transport system involved in multi-copper enzyme maturation, permease component [Natronobacterium texcoconense]